jgi:hypothetical protein
MTIQVWIQVSVHPQVLDPMGAGSGSFFHPRVEPAPDPHRTGFMCRSHFSPVGAPETRTPLPPPKKPPK